MILGLFGVHWVMPCHVLDLWAGWQGRLSDHRNMVVWKIIRHCLMWYLWRERNARHLRTVKDLHRLSNFYFSKLCMIGFSIWVYFQSIPWWK
jgi:hypothetical protein